MADRAEPVPGDPSRYRYARAERRELTLPPEQAVELQLRSLTGVHEGPIPQDALDGIDGFWLHLHRPADFTLLARARKLEWLAVEAPFDIDLSGLADALAGAGSLNNLHIQAPVTDIKPLAALTGLTILRLEHTRVTDLTPLADLPRLHDLGVESGPLADLTPLAGKWLSRLFVYRTRVADLSPLAGIPTLQVLGLAGCPVRDLSVVTELPALHFVSLHRTPVTEADLGDLPARAPGVTFEGVGTQAEEPEADADGDGDRPPAADLLAEFRTTEDFTRKWSLVTELIATRDREAVEAAIRDRTEEDVTLRGLFLQGGTGNIPFAANPWNVPADAGLPRALDRIWRPVADLAPRFMAVLRARTLGLALLADDDGTPSLAYLTWGRDEDRDTWRPAWQAAADPVTLDGLRGHDDVYLQVVVGTAPHVVDPEAVDPLLAGPVPRPVRDFWAIHHSLGAEHRRSIGGKLARNTLGFFGDDGWDVVMERTGGVPPDRLVISVGEGDFDSYVLDLDVLDPAGNPTVARWAWKEWTTGDHQQFWDWLDSEGARLALL